MKVKLKTNDIKNINFFHKLTKAEVIDCLENDIIYFVVAEGQYGLAVGKKGAKIKNAENKFNKKIKVFEFSEDLKQFAKNLVPEAEKVEIDDDDVIYHVKKSDRAKIIGKEGRNINAVKEFLQRQFDVDNVKVV